jgi:hypothetical protein
MTPPGDAFYEYCVEGIKSFVQTAIVIDDEAFFPPLGADSKAEGARTATRSSGSVMEPNPVSGSAVTTNESAMANHRVGGEPTDTQIGPLDAKAITDAFHSIQVVCGLYRPTPEEDAADLATRAAQHADIVILDWFLDKKNHDSAKAKQVIRSILTKDLAEYGRLRLIAIYTSEGDVPRLAKDVFDFLNEDETLKDRFALPPGEKALTREDARICFFNKRTSVNASPPDIVAEKDLPDRLMREFAFVTEGVLSTFAVNAIAAVRRASHHIVALFGKQLDGAYIAHRCRLPEPEDAKEFAAELIADELRNVITMADVAERCMGLNILDLWIDHVSTANQHVFRNHLKGTDYSADQMKRLLRVGYEEKADRPSRLRAQDIEGLFFKRRADSGRRSLEFARLSNLKREPRGRSRFPAAWVPTLMIGSVLKMCRTRPETKETQEVYRDLSFDYLVCTQPKCHSVRLPGETSFPFQSAFASAGRFNLVVKDNEVAGTGLMVGWKPRDTVVIRFAPLTPGQSIHAVRSGENFEFEDSVGRKFLWLGDIKDMKAQRDASELARHIHTPGVDDYEWLRVASESDKIDFDAENASD